MQVLLIIYIIFAVVVLTFLSYLVMQLYIMHKNEKQCLEWLKDEQEHLREQMYVFDQLHKKILEDE